MGHAITAIIRAVGEKRASELDQLATQLLRQGLKTRIVTQIPGDSPNTTLERVIAEPVDTHRALLLEDDVVLAPDFHERVKRYLAHGWPLLSGFSRRKEDLETYLNGEDHRIMPYPVYYSTMCLVILNELRSDLLEFCKKWYVEHESRTAADLMCSAWAKSHKIPIRVAIPSLVQHRSIVSVIDRRRSRNRRSETFKRHYGEIGE